MTARALTVLRGLRVRTYLISPVSPWASAGPCRLTALRPCSGTWPSTDAESGWSSPAWMRANLAFNTASAASVRAILATPIAARASRSACAAA